MNTIQRMKYTSYMVINSFYKGRVTEMSIHDCIESIRKRPGMYLGSNSITALLHFLNGYRMAEREINSEQSKVLLPLDFSYMHEFVNLKLGYSNNLGWCYNLLNLCNGDEASALNKFFEFYDEFVKTGVTRYWKSVLSADNIRCNDNMEHGYVDRMNQKEPFFYNPKAVYVIELTISACILAVETSEGMHFEKRFYPTAESCMRKSIIPFNAEIFFGKIENWEEHVVENGKMV